MTKLDNRQKGLLRLILISIAGALFFSWLLWLSAYASTTMLLRLWHDQDGNATISTGDIPASGITITITELTCSDPGVCSASPGSWSVTTDTDGYASITLHEGEYRIDAPCLSLTVQASDVSGQAAQDEPICRLHQIWLANIQKGG